MPTLPPTPAPQVVGNLRPRTLSGWDNPLVATQFEGSRNNGALVYGGKTFISWAIANIGTGDIQSDIFVDLLFDNVTVERWVVRGMPVNSSARIEDWADLGSRVNIKAGGHKLKLVVDSTNLIPETDESDNAFEWQFDWIPTQGSTTPTPTPSNLPDLVPAASEDRETPIVATSYQGDRVSGPLSVDVPTYVEYGISNQGFASTGQDIWVYLYFDDYLVDRQLIKGLTAHDTASRPEWDGLFQATRVAPGAHILKMVVDATNLVNEFDETNNVFEQEFIWETGPVPPRPLDDIEAQPTPPAPLMLPNLVPGWKYGWDGPIVVSNSEGEFKDSPLVVGQTPYVDVVIANLSAVETNGQTVVDLYFDDIKVHTFTSGAVSPPMGGGAIRFWSDWDGLASRANVTEGPHTLKIVINPQFTVVEASEQDNVFEKTFVWQYDPDESGPQPIAYTNDQLKAKLSELRMFLLSQELAFDPGGADRTARVLDIAEAGYYLIAGKSFKDERVDIHLLSHDDYAAWIDADFAEKLAVSDSSEYDSILARREFFKENALGFKTRRFGKIAIVVDAERPIAEVVDSLAHELGHMRQDLLNPSQTEAGDSHFINGIQEAQAQQFQRVFWLTLETFTAQNLIKYPDSDAFRRLIDRRFEFWLGDVNSDEHSLGRILQWLVVMDDPELRDLRDALLSRWSLNAAESLRLYDYLVALDPKAINAYVSERMRAQAISAHMKTITTLAKSRLVKSLNPDMEGHPTLRPSSLMSP
ncbi:MAG: hypothetical protein L0177_03110 [Chloroflexi bacterium]|nr:hypothetical protein [Chloroflexota bacterium]